MASEAVVKCIEELLDGYVSHTTVAYAKTLQQDLMVEDSSAIAKGNILQNIETRHSIHNHV